MVKRDSFPYATQIDRYQLVNYFVTIGRVRALLLVACMRLYKTMSVGPSVSSNFRSCISLFRGLQRLITAPAQPHATEIAVYTALLKKRKNSLFKILISCCFSLLCSKKSLSFRFFLSMRTSAWKIEYIYGQSTKFVNDFLYLVFSLRFFSCVHATV